MSFYYIYKNSFGGTKNTSAKEEDLGPTEQFEIP
jgi:hypothetical protein